MRCLINPYYITISDACDSHSLLDTIKEFGHGLCEIILLLNDYDNYQDALGYITSPDLKKLTLGAHFHHYIDHDDHQNLLISDNCLELLSKRCKKLRDLKIIKAYIHYSNEDDFKEKFPNCNVEIEDCVFLCEGCAEFTDECMCHRCKICGESDCDEQDSSSESTHDADEINNILDN